MNQYEIPTVSVIIPTYNRAHLIERALRSVQNQTERKIEIIVVDDASTDETSQTVKRIDDPRIRYIQRETNAGAAAARNTGIKSARGEFIAFLDSDDEWLPEKLEMQLKVFEFSELAQLGVVICGMSIRMEDGSEQVSIPRPRGWVFENLLRFEYPSTTSAFLVRNESIKTVGGFDETLKTFDDFDIFVRLARASQVDHVNEALYVWHQHSGPRVSAKVNEISALHRLLEKYTIELNQRPQVHAHYHAKLARMYGNTGNFRKQQIHLGYARQIAPQNLQYKLLYMATQGGASFFELVFGVYKFLSRVKKGIGG